MDRKHICGLGGACLVALAVGAVPASADLLSYTDPTEFESAVADLTEIDLDWDSLEVGTTIQSGDTLNFGALAFEWTFSFFDCPPENPDCGSAIITDQFDALSPNVNLFGANAQPSFFLPGDAVTVTKTSGPGLLAIGLYINSSPFTPEEILLTVGSDSVTIAGPPLETLPDGGELFFLGMVSDTAFTEWAVSSEEASGLFGYLWDETKVYIPEPATLVLLVFGAVCGLRTPRCECRARWPSAPRSPDGV